MALNTSELGSSPVPAAAPSISIRFPGGIRMSGLLSRISPASRLENGAAALGRASAGLGPLGTVFTLLEAMLAVKDFAEAVPQLVVNPDPLLDALEKLFRAVSKLASLVPQLSVPILIYDFVVAALELVAGLVEELQALAAQLERIAEAEARIADAPELAVVCASARADVATQMANLEAGVSEVGLILTVVGTFGEAIGLSAIPVPGPMGSDPGAAAEALGEVVRALEVFRDALPL